MARYDGRANLIQNQPGGLTPERARENGRKGGLASAESRRHRKQLRTLLSQCMTNVVTDEDVKHTLIDAGYEPSFENAMTLAALVKAARGDIEAMRYVRDTLGEKPTETYNLAMEARPIKAIDLSDKTDQELEALADQLDE